MDYQNRHVVVTGGTGALGTAVVGTLLAAGAVCHVPYYSEEEAKRFAHRNHKQVSLVPLGNLADEPAVTAFYGGLNALWASIHIAGGFAFAPIAQSDKSLLTAQLESNLISAYLCSRAESSMSRHVRLWSHASVQASRPILCRRPAWLPSPWRWLRRSLRRVSW
jgi:NAD(P)-dependent dehydrogenase (short-subunit alcohol dehydrogenase family)